MTLFEAGILSGTLAGAVVGGVVGAPSGALAIAGAAAGGAVAGGIAGWAYAYSVMFLLAVVGVLWRAARGRTDDDAVPTESEIARMTKIGVVGVILGVAALTVLGLTLGWLHALTAAGVVASATALVAVARVQSA